RQERRRARSPPSSRTRGGRHCLLPDLDRSDGRPPPHRDPIVPAAETPASPEIDPGLAVIVENRSHDTGFIVIAEDRTNDAGFLRPVPDDETSASATRPLRRSALPSRPPPVACDGGTSRAAGDRR